jgi:methyl-accepting chemotaxis protein
VEQINKAVAEMDKVVQRNAASAEESASASEEMNGQAEQMKEFVSELAMLAHGARNGSGSKPVRHAHAGAAALPRKSMKISASPPSAHLPRVRAAKGPTKPVKGREVSPEQVIPMEGSFEEF